MTSTARSIGAFWLLVPLASCGASELTRLETEQRALETEVATLRQTVDDLRGEMQRKGVIQAGPDGARPRAAGAVAPAEDLSEVFPPQISRADDTLDVTWVSGPERRGDTECGWRVGLQHLEPISDFALAADGLGRASPVMVSLDGRPLQPHSPPSGYDTCSGAFRHQSKYLFYSPSSAAADPTQLQARLSNEVAVTDEQGRPRYWVYPGSTLTIETPEPWSADWGSPHLVFDLRLRGVGLPNQPAARSTGAVTLGLPERELSSREATWRGSEELPGEGPWTVTIHSPADGPFVLVDALAIGNGAFATVVTSKQHDGVGE